MQRDQGLKPGDASCVASLTSLVATQRPGTRRATCLVRDMCSTDGAATGVRLCRDVLAFGCTCTGMHLHRDAQARCTQGAPALGCTCTEMHPTCSCRDALQVGCTEHTTHSYASDDTCAASIDFHRDVTQRTHPINLPKNLNIDATRDAPSVNLSPSR